MTELDLYKFVQHKEIEWHGDKLLLWLDGYDLKDFSEVEGDCIVEDGGYPVHLVHDGTICIELNDVCDLHGIDPNNILEKGD